MRPELPKYKNLIKTLQGKKNNSNNNYRAIAVMNIIGKMFKSNPMIYKNNCTSETNGIILYARVVQNSKTN